MTIEYDDEAYAAATQKLNSAVSALWNAGATIQNIQDELANAIEEASGKRVEVEILYS